ncbi:hypothetical protein Pcinc_010186 [Petrolisthes cinctipes]|uniref:Uncharacterized protein n=1 Tax=Petrolisthes cinctipes TaxID=88211 RepID=A0AAE1KUQ9_PETCI|nr:hypothetical protein Pcinc_010186 [Petrolisthes cinctipes]
MGEHKERVVRVSEWAWDRVIGRHGVGKCNINGLLLRTCATHDLAITDTMFRLPNRNKHWHLIDYIIVRAKDRRDVPVTRSMCGADCWMDHHLIISKLNIHIQPQRRPQGQRVAKRLDVSKLRCSPTAQELVSALDCKLAHLQANSDDIEKDWETLKTSVHSTTFQVIGPATRNHQDWVNENDAEIQKLLEEKRQLLRAHQNVPTSAAKKAAFVSKHSIVQARLRSMQDACLSNKTDEIQGFADRHDTKRFYDALKAVYGPPSCGSLPLLSADRTTLLKDKKENLERWAEHFYSVLNRPSTINNEDIARLPSEHMMQLEMDSFLSAYNNFGLTISTRKTEVMFLPAHGNQYHNLYITVKGQRLQAVDNFTYLGSTLSRSVNINAKCQGKRLVGGQRKRFKDSLKTSLKYFSISNESWETLARDSPTWRSHIQQGAKLAKEERTKTAEKKREHRKARAASVTDTAPTHRSPICGGGLSAQIGLISHLRTQRSGSSTKK